MTLLPSGARTAAGNGDLLDLSQFERADRTDEIQFLMPPMLRAQLDVTAVSGTATPTLTMLIEDSVDGVNYNTVGTFANATAVSRTVINIGIRGDANPAGFAWPFNHRKIRVRWTMTGNTPSFTCSVKGQLLP
jgi:hypothetical protein